MTGGCNYGCGDGCAGTGASSSRPCAGPSSRACCEGEQALTPAAIGNPPGLSQIAYRAGTQASFLETMRAASVRRRRAGPQRAGRTHPGRPLHRLS